MAFLRSLRQNFVALQDIFRKRKRSLSSTSPSRRDSAAREDNNSENNPVRTSPGPGNQTTHAQDVQRLPQTGGSSKVDGNNSVAPRVRSGSRPPGPPPPVVKRRARRDGHVDDDNQGRSQTIHTPTTTTTTTTTIPTTAAAAAAANVCSRRGPRSSIHISSLSSDGPESPDSEAEDKGVARCQCSKNSPFLKSSDAVGKGQLANLAQDIYGESGTTGGSRRKLSSCHLGDKSAPSTSRQSAEPGGPRDAGKVRDTGQSSCSLEEEDQLMEEMVTTLKTRGSLSRRRSRSRSRRSRPRQSYDTGLVVVNNVRLLQTHASAALPRRETDSDESNTSLHDLSTAFLSSSSQDRHPHHRHHTSSSAVQSDSSFHSVTDTESETCPTLQASSANTKMGAEEEEGEGGGTQVGEVDQVGEEGEEGREAEEWVGVNTTEHNRSSCSRSDADPPSTAGGVIGVQQQQQQQQQRQQQMEAAGMPNEERELTPYGPEEFVLDLLMAMCRGTWSDIL